jgi:phosphoglycolate phosphatase-like HAD superfamily hydrolase
VTGIIFDLDGALLRVDVDIEEVRLSLSSLFSPYGVTRPFRPILARIGAAAEEAAARGGDAAALRRRGLEILDRWEVAGAASARPRDGAAEVTGELARRGRPLGLLTNLGRAAVGPALAAAKIDAGRFAAIVTRDDAAPKPAPDGLVSLAVRLPGEPLWYVVDHAIDVDAARAARPSVPRLRVAALGGVAGADRSLADLRAVLEL